MPHINVIMLQGRTDEQKKRATEMLTAALSEAINCSEDKISVSIVDDITGEQWMDRLNEQISGKEKFITKKSNSIK